MFVCARGNVCERERDRGGQLERERESEREREKKLFHYVSVKNVLLHEFLSDM